MRVFEPFARKVGLIAWPYRCCLCAQTGMDGRDLCQACYALAWRNTPACHRCALPLARDGEAYCGSCLHGPDHLLAVHATWRYAPPLDALVKRCKFSGDLAAGAVLAHLMLDDRPPWLQDDDILVPVPLHRRRLRQRGLDQSRELTRALARGTGCAWQDVLLRHAATQAQSSLALADRQRNLRNAFSVRRAVPERIVLVDDVMTSGATLQAAAQTLMRSGASEVRAWVAARTP